LNGTQFFPSHSSSRTEYDCAAEKKARRTAINRHTNTEDSQERKRARGQSTERKRDIHKHNDRCSRRERRECVQVRTTRSLMRYMAGADDSPTRWWRTSEERITPRSLNAHVTMSRASSRFPDLEVQAVSAARGALGDMNSTFGLCI
jgi:hypothetical protein